MSIQDNTSLIKNNNDIIDAIKAKVNAYSPSINPSKYGILPQPLSNVRIKQIAKKTYKVTWTVPFDENRTGIQVLWKVTGIPTIPDTGVNTIDLGADVTEVVITVDDEADMLGVWVIPKKGETAQTLRTDGNTEQITGLLSGGVVEGNFPLTGYYSVLLLPSGNFIIGGYPRRK